MAWAALDREYAYAQTNNIAFKEHNFIWGNQQPSWVNNSNAQTAVQAWMTAFCQRYPNTKLIDVVNEPPPHTTPAYINGIGGTGASGYDWIANAFKWARAATLVKSDPTAGVDNLPRTGTLPLVQGGEDPGDQQQPAAGKVAQQVQRRYRLVGRTDRVQHTRGGQVRDVMPGRVRPRTGTPPARHPAVHQPRVDRAAVVGSDAQPFGDAWPKAFDQRVRPAGEGTHHGRRLRALEVERDRPLAPPEQVVPWITRYARTVRPVDPQHLRAKVGQQHAGERSRPQSGDLDDPQPL